MRYVTLGRTGLAVSEVGFGCIPIIRLSTDDAVAVLRHAFDRGITFFDTANAYRDSEEKIGAAFAGMRDKVVLATKTLLRGAEGATMHLENSLRMLRTDHLDLYQLHQIAQEKDWQEVMGPSGALEAVMKAKAEGKVRHVGVTSHNLQMALTLVNSGLFDTIQFPFNLIEEGAKDELIGAARDRGMGFIVMKPFGGGAIDNAAVAFKYLREHPDAIPIPGFESIAQVDEVLSFYARPNVVTGQDREAMEQYRGMLGKSFCRRCEYCQPCPRGVMITPAMGYPIVASRMSPAVAVQFSQKPMESVPLCNECGACVERCPYELQIPEMLKANRALYEKHLREAQA
ncbi:aldo/keto reductase [Geobacter sp. SVR]|uniref:aldo/keto reductase n=1 Tax=Geobacter sp. SVR TaxID=2495594 RepID=UPI00143F01C7|nr:aldo/keto reductase [Geobacter sp. SVR]BCS52718.1 aldo/keto reductase [Geobacter sp. SVR]GCF86786.1 aldo/keto reductase [Geobacter sp. SVR]